MTSTATAPARLVDAAANLVGPGDEVYYGTRDAGPDGLTGRILYITPGGPTYEMPLLAIAHGNTVIYRRSEHVELLRRVRNTDDAA